MNESKISTRYAKALFESALEQNQLDVVRNDMTQLYAIAHDQRFVSFIEDPAVKMSQKRKQLTNLFSGSFSKVSVALVDLVTQNKREGFLQSIARNFLALYKRHKGIKSGKLVTAVSLDDSTSKQIEGLLSAKMKGSSIELEREVNADLIGGFVLTIEDQQIDASIKTRLAALKRDMLNTRA